MWRLLASLGEFGEGGEGEGVRSDRLIAGLVGEMNEERKSVVRKVSTPTPSHYWFQTFIIPLSSFDAFPFNTY